jgi:UDP-N-acetylmuramoyl-tripeptide--D-alanyl-D-alanine ligase
LEIITAMQAGSILFVNGETPYLELIHEIAEKKNILVKTFGLEQSNDFYPEKYTITNENITIVYDNNEYSAPLYGLHNVYNMFVAILVALELSINIKDIQEGVSNCSLADHRSSVIDNGYIVIDDTYNSNPLSSRVALQTISEVYPDRRKVAVLSDMLELGDKADEMHQEIGQAVITNKFNKLFTWGELSKNYVEGALSAGAHADDVMHFESKEELSKQLQAYLAHDDVVLVKGSRSMKMEEIVEMLIQKEE